MNLDAVCEEVTILTHEIAQFLKREVSDFDKVNIEYKGKNQFSFNFLRF
jgi:hypothetical protein